MKTDLHVNFKEYFWNSLNKITNTFSDLTIKNLRDGYIKCFWNISPIDNLRIKLSNSYFYAIRLFDITNNRNKNSSTCIMKEIQVSKFKSSITFPLPIAKGVYCFEFGYRKKNGEWRKLACQNLNLGYRIKKSIRSIKYENWFDSKIKSGRDVTNPHEEAYQLSFNRSIGGSEKIYS